MFKILTSIFYKLCSYQVICRTSRIDGLATMTVNCGVVNIITSEVFDKVSEKLI